MSDKTYNGWSNYETWNVALWLGNEQGSENEICAMARDANDVYSLSKQIESYIDEFTPDLGASMFADLLSAAVSKVNWYEIAEHYWEDNHENEEDESETAAEADE